MKKPKQKKPALDKLRAIKDCATGKWSYEFGFAQAGGARGRVIVPGDQANKTATLIDQLNLRGAELPTDPETRKMLVNDVIAKKPNSNVHQLANAGWQLRKGAAVWFCLGRRLIGAPEGRLTFLPPLQMEKSRASRFAEHGTLEDWRSEVAATAMLSTCLTIALSASFAAPLLVASGLQNFSLQIFGPSRAGKTTALLGAMSVFGLSTDEQLTNWNATKAHLLEAASSFNDVLFPLNEVGAATGKRKQAYDGLRDLYAQFAEGSDRERHSSFQPHARHFRGICIATAEHSLSWYAEAAGEVRDGGELFRAIDVSAVRDVGKTILDRAPADIDQQKRLQELRNALKRCHGVAGTSYIEHLISMGPVEVKRRVGELIADFVGRMPVAAHDPIAGQMAMNYGLLYAGATLAIEARILPWSLTHLKQTLALGFGDAFEYSRPVDLLRLGLEILKSKLRDEIVERTERSDFGVKDHSGFWRRDEAEKIIVVHARRFRSWFSGEKQYRRVVEWLYSEGWAKASADARHRAPTDRDLGGSTLRWPDGKVVRSIAFRDPFANETPATSPESPAEAASRADWGKGKGARSSPPTGSGKARGPSAAKVAKAKFTNRLGPKANQKLKLLRKEKPLVRPRFLTLPDHPVRPEDLGG